VNWLTLVTFVAGLVLLCGGAEMLVRAASRLAQAVGISPLVVGLTVVAFGTSAPELAVSVRAVWTDRPDVAIGNVLGSNISNVLLILGASALAAPLVVQQRLLRVDVPLMVAASLVVLVMALDGAVGRVDGLVLFAGVVAYVVFAVRQSRRESAAVREEYERAYGKEQPAPRGLLAQALLVVAGLALLLVGSHLLVEGAIEIAAALGLSELVISLTVVAVGTSLPELATSVVASLRGERDIAVGNVVGSNLFNLLAVLGVTAVVAPDGVHVPDAALSFDFPVMVAVSLACLPVFFVGYRIARWEGALFLGFYGVYVAYLVMSATESPRVDAFQAALLYFVFPLTALTLGVVYWRQHHR
jgi:cation:H+ antiporter